MEEGLIRDQISHRVHVAQINQKQLLSSFGRKFLIADGNLCRFFLCPQAAFLLLTLTLIGDTKRRFFAVSAGTLGSNSTFGVDPHRAWAQGYF